jgi:hypothetical protein
MPITLGDVRTSPINTEKCERKESQILDIFNEGHDLNLRELIFILGQLLIDIGGTLEQIDEKLTCNDMWRRYAVNPTLGNALIAQGADILYEWVRIPQNEEE